MWSTASDRTRAAEEVAVERQRKVATLASGDRVLTLRIVYNPAQMERDSEFAQNRRADDNDSFANIIVGDIEALLEDDDIAVDITVLSDE